MLASILFALLPLVSAIVTPTTPDGSTVINEGGSIDAAWTADDTGSWTNMTIQLMTGDNLSMIPLKTLITGVDGTTTTTFSTPAPEVSPNSKIYFLQFTNGADPTATWTTRFTIAGADGSSTAPEQTTNYNGEDVQWGIGAIIGDATGNSTTPSASGAVSAAASSASASTSTGSGITNYGPSSATSAIANPSNGSGPSRAASAGNAASSASSAVSGAAASSTPSTNSNSAASVASHVAAGGIVGVVGLVMGLVL